VSQKIHEFVIIGFRDAKKRQQCFVTALRFLQTCLDDCFNLGAEYVGMLRQNFQALMKKHKVKKPKKISTQP